MSYKIISLNVDSVVRANRKTLLKEFIDETTGDIILLQETKLDNTLKLQIHNYNVFRCDIKRGWGGVALIVKNHIPVRNVFCIRTPFHAIFIECKIKDTWQRFCSCYIPHKITDISLNFNNFFAKYPDTIFGGDFNSRHHSFGDVSSNLYGIGLVDSATTLRFKILNPPGPTCFASVNGSFIDKFIFTNSSTVSSEISLLPSFSDHSGILIEIPGAPPNQCSSTQQNKMFHRANIVGINKSLQHKLSSLDIPTFSNLTDDNCEHIATSFDHFMKNTIDKYVPSNKLHRHKIILSPATRALQQKSKSLQRKLHRDQGLTPLFEKQRILCELRLIKTMILNSVNSETSKFFTNKYNAVQSNRDAYRVIKNFSGHKRKALINGSLATDSTKTQFISGNDNIANLLADRFESNHRLTHTQQSVDDTSATAAADNLRLSNAQIVFSHDIPANIVTNDQLDIINSILPPEKRDLLTSAEEVSHIISTRPNKKSCGSDNMPYFILKQLNFSVILLMATFFNHLISSSYFPKIWRHALVTPIPKPGKDSTLIENWRPISLLNCISKIYERLIATRLSKITTNLNIFQNQFGFLGGHSTEHALSKFQSDVIRGLNNNKITTTILLDLKAAFDTIWHDGLIQRMIELGINKLLIKIIQSMLTNRTFAVRLGNYTTDPREMLAGVPQGSVLGPPCFNIFLYNIPTDLFIKILQYADDTTLYITHNNPINAQARLNSYLVKLSKYFENSKLILNHQKSELINIMGYVRDTNSRLRSKAKNIKITINGNLIPHSNNVRLLGVQFQTNNRFTRHVNIRIQKAKGARFHTAKLLRNKFIPISIKCSIYKQFLRPILTYASPVWCRPPSISSHQMERLRKFERDCLRSAANIKRPRGSFKHINIKAIYSQTNCMRIDRFIAKNHVNFFQRIRLSNREKFNTIINQVSNGPYPNIDHIHTLHESGNLILNDQMLLFHQRYNGNGLVYNTGQ